MLTPFISQNVHFPLSLQHHPCRVLSAYMCFLDSGFWFRSVLVGAALWHLFQVAVFVILLNIAQPRQERALL